MAGIPYPLGKEFSLGNGGWWISWLPQAKFDTCCFEEARS